MNIYNLALGVNIDFTGEAVPIAEARGGDQIGVVTASTVGGTGGATVSIQGRLHHEDGWSQVASLVPNNTNLNTTCRLMPQMRAVLSGVSGALNVRLMTG